MQEHELWLLFAERDLKGAKKCLVGEEILVSPALVLAQQSAEKALKGYLFTMLVIQKKRMI